MPTDWTYAVELRDEAGEIHAYCPEVPEAIAAGATEADALREMGEALIAVVRFAMKRGEDLSPPRREPPAPHCVSLPGRLAAKASVYVAWKHSGLSKVALAERLDRNEIEVRRILDPDHGTKLDQLDEAAAALGGRLSVVFVPAGSEVTDFATAAAGQAG